MKTHEAILSNLHSARYIMTRYLEDLSDQDLVVRPHPNAHHIAWQLGHLVLSEAQMVKSVAPEIECSLPADFVARHDTSCATRSQRTDFYAKVEYWGHMQRVREVTVEALARFSSEDLSAPGPEKMRSYAPLIGSVFLAIANHEIMHSGQIAVVRRVLSKPVVI